MKKKLWASEKELIEYTPVWEKMRHHRPRLLLHIMLFLLLFTISAAVFGAFVMEVDTHVVARGKLITKENVIKIDSAFPGVLAEFNNNIGDRVTLGEILAVLDRDIVKGDKEEMLSRLRFFNSRIKRLEVERYPDKFSFDNDSTVSALEKGLYNSRRSAHLSFLEAQEDKINGLRKHIESLQSELDVVEDQHDLAKKIMDEKERLYKLEVDIYNQESPRKEGYLNARNQWLESTRREIAIKKNMQEASITIKNIEKERQRYNSEREADVVEQLLNSKLKKETLLNDIATIDKKEKLFEIRSPANAILQKTAEKEIGGVIQSGEWLFDLVNSDSPLEAIIDIHSQDISRIKINDLVIIKLDTLPFAKNGVLYGRLRLISENTWEKNITNQDAVVYRGWVELGRSSLRNLPKKFRFQPGLLLEANVETGKRTLISYLIYPIIRGIDESFREP